MIVKNNNGLKFFKQSLIWNLIILLPSISFIPSFNDGKKKNDIKTKMSNLFRNSTIIKTLLFVERIYFIISTFTSLFEFKYPKSCYVFTSYDIKTIKNKQAHFEIKFNSKHTKLFKNNISLFQNDFNDQKQSLTQ